ncbi:MAG TPA: glycosyltransferase [Castellaniella sp.]|uniref:glycosyltransferase n=1 Tax=Castellaniella sp. TaxID=1955812 RepID=UPI002EF9CA20
MSVAEIGKICQPCVWTLHDMWAFCGSEHYAADDISARWRAPYTTSNRASNESGLDVSRWVWLRKKRAWQYPLQVVAPSQWLANCVRGSELMGGWPVSVVPNVLDTEQFQPWPKALARKLLGLPENKQLVLFGAIGGGTDPRKGWDLLQGALEALAAAHPNLECVVFGQSEPVHPPELGLPIHWLGRLNDDTTIALAYGAADVTVVPSRQENLPQTGTEAQACGCPVVAFNCTGLPDVVVHGETGYLARPYDVADLAHGICWVLEDIARHAALCAAARERAVRLWSPAVVVPQYLSIYQEAIDRWHKTYGQPVNK